ncbi:type II secretion system minor pseudopilin GspJ [Serratia entomophila]|uniref:type II secretion system minor pseudopilin GspJ n=1 Tax=Serratia entomophila TaxID=42906 RepID=UPI002178BE43|nr:type II secretion system minor pseudopilin GspJ [Serratia entomophila]CAI1654503.1 PilD-dependent protein pddD [Serratia entomophila]CAI1695077.1 PilD-dependent protein pddD [Serratia entomophila]
MNSRPQRGFTLVEMMLAIVIFSLLSLLALMIFQGVLKNSEIVQGKAAQMVQLQRALNAVERDFSHALARVPVNLAAQPGMPEFEARQAADGAGNYRVMLIRHGWQNPGGRLPRSTLERVEYRLEQGWLTRLSYPELNGPASAARRVTLLAGVRRFQLRFYYQGEWLAAWRASTWLPQAVEIAVDTGDLGPVRRIVLLPSEDKS